MIQYTIFADYYDLLTEDIEYDRWAEYIEEILKRHNKKPKLVLDLACGTGNMTIELAKKGYDMIGIDISPEMLNVAKNKSYNNKCDILFLEQDITDFELYGTVDAIISFLDSINYVIDDDKLLNMFKLVNNYLNPDGIFIFDINSKYKLANVLGGNSYIYDKDDVFCTWESYFDDKDMLCEFYITMFIKDKEQLYKRYYETHIERAYSIDEIKYYLDRAELELLDIYNELTFKQPTETSERIFFICKKRSN